MTSMKAVVKNFRPLEGRAYIALIGLAIFMNMESSNPVELLKAFFAGVLFVWYTFSINNCFDVDTDSLNPKKAKKNPIASGQLTLTQGLFISGLLGVAGVGIAYSINREAFALYVLMITLATVYSAPPRLKARPVVDLVSHGLFFGGLPFLYGALIDGNFSEKEVIMAIAITIYSLALELRNHLNDYESDLKAGLRTTSIAIGKRRSHLLVEVFSITAIGMVLITLNLAMVVASPAMVLGKTLGIEQERVYRVFDAAMVALLLAAGGMAP